MCATDPILLAPSSSDAEAKQKRDDISFRTALGEDYDLIQRLHRSVRETELCGTPPPHSHAPLRLTQHISAHAHIISFTEPGKLRVLQLLLRKWKAEGHKVLIFSKATRMLNIIENFIRREGCALD